MSASFTAYFNLAKPATGDLDWGPEVDGNFDQIDVTMRSNMEDRFLRFMGGGVLLYDALTGQVSFTEDITIHHGVTGYVSTIPATQSPLVVSSQYHLVYANITRNPQANEQIKVANGNLFNDQLVIPATNQAILLLIRDNASPTNNVVLPNGELLQDGVPGNLQDGSAVNLQNAYDNSSPPTIAVDGDPLTILGADVPTNTAVQTNLAFTATNDEVNYPTPTAFAVQFTVGAVLDISQLAFRMSQVGTPLGNWRYQIVRDSTGLPSTAGPDLLYSSSYSPVSALPVVPAAQYVNGGPSLVQLIPGTYWFVLNVDATYQGSVDVGDYITVAEASAGAAAATYNGLSTLWTASGAHYYNEIYSTAPGEGPTLLELTSGGDGQTLVGAPLVTTKDVTHELANTGLVGLSVVSITSPGTLVVNTVEAQLTVNPGDDLYLTDANNVFNNGLYRILTRAVNTPSSGQTTYTINTTSSLQQLGYRIAFNTEGSGALANILRASDTNRLFQIENSSLADLFEVDSFRNRVVLSADFLVTGLQTRLVSLVDLFNLDSTSGSSVVNVQRELNGEATFTGRTLNGVYTLLPAWVHNDVGTTSDNLWMRAEALTAKFNATTGHDHTGAFGDAPQISAPTLVNVPLQGYGEQGTNYTSTASGSDDVSSLLIGKTASAGSSSLGVVVTAPYNRVILRNSSDDKYTDALGNEVYGRLTFATSVWTVTYYSLVTGTETPYTFLATSPIVWYYQELFNPMVTTPTYSPAFFIPSDNATADVIDATPTLRGLVSAGAQSIGGPKNFVDTTQSTTTTSGALVTGGGLGVAKNANIGGNAIVTGTIGASNFSGSSSGTNTGDVTLAAVGSAPNANGASLAGQILTLQPASSSFPGAMTAIAQVLAGLKTWVNGMILQAYLAMNRNDVASTATIVALDTSKSFVKLTGSTTTVIQGAVAGVDGQTLLIYAGSAPTSILSENGSATAANRFHLPGGSTIMLTADQSVEFIYDLAQTRWVLKSSSGSGGNSSRSLVWVEDSGAPDSGLEFHNNVYFYGSGLSQFLYLWITVPKSYVPGNTISLNLDAYSPDSTGTGTLATTATLIRPGTDAMNSTTNQKTSSNTFSLAVANVAQTENYALTDSSGNINSVPVAPGSLILVALTRGVDTGVSDLRVPASGAAEVLFS